MPERKYCPQCGKQTLRFIETCNEDDTEVKTSWTCDCSDIVVYIVEFKEAKS